MMTYYLRKLISLFQADPLIRMVISFGLLIGLLFIVSLLPESLRIKAGIGVVIFVGVLNFKTVLSWLKEFFQ